MTVAVKEKLPTKKLSTTYDRIYSIADRLFKKHNPCKICTENGKTKCINKNYKSNHLCYQYWNDRCQHWQNGCTIKCLACKLFICSEIRDNEKNTNLIKTINRLCRIALRHGLSRFDYYTTKKIVIQNTHDYWRK